LRNVRDGDKRNDTVSRRTRNDNNAGFTVFAQRVLDLHVSPVVRASSIAISSTIKADRFSSPLAGQVAYFSRNNRSRRRTEAAGRTRYDAFRSGPFRTAASDGLRLKNAEVSDRADRVVKPRREYNVFHALRPAPGNALEVQSARETNDVHSRTNDSTALRVGREASIFLNFILLSSFWR